MTLAVEIAVLLACIAIIIFVPAVIVALCRLHNITEKVLQAINELREESRPLMRTLHATAEQFHALSVKAEEQWYQVETIVAAAREWTDRVDGVVAEVESVDKGRHAVREQAEQLRTEIGAEREAGRERHG